MKPTNIKITMTIKSALNLAIEALEAQASESYEGDELNDPTVKQWVGERYDAARILKRQLAKL